ncbi:hypothetical protein A1D31_14070 [Bradyrhizobium liaoningense]|nr:hypothetical protein A1D31_14070 [Bradyrhizobium liaoningense]
MILPEKALSIIQPWPWLIVHGYKDIENRDWPTRYRGPVAIHAGKKLDDDCAWDIHQKRHPVTGDHHEFDEPADYERGGIIGVAEIVDCVESSDSPWFVGRYGFVLRNARPVLFIPVKGALGFFNWQDRRI